MYMLLTMWEGQNIKDVSEKTFKPLLSYCKKSFDYQSSAFVYFEFIKLLSNIELLRIQDLHFFECMLFYELLIILWLVSISIMILCFWPMLP